MDAAWLGARGISSSLRAKYVAAGWLEQPAPRTFRRPRGDLGWEQVVVSLQALLGRRLVVGGLAALEMQGHGHFARFRRSEVPLHGPERPPTWLAGLTLDQRFVWRGSRTLFGDDLADVAFPTLAEDGASAAQGGEPEEGDGAGTAGTPEAAGLRVLPYGQWDWPLVVSTPERAVLELMDELPDREAWGHVDAVMEGLAGLSPRRLQALLVRCRSIKAKRLLLFFADRHGHGWLRHLDRAAIDLGTGKRSLMRGGRLDPATGITVPRDLPPVELILADAASENAAEGASSGGVLLMSGAR